jgi:ribosome-associated protein
MSDHDDDDRGESRRTIARRQRREAGDLSAKLANDLMKLPATALGELDLDDDLREVIDRTRAISSQKARRRAERSLAGELRNYDLADLAAQLARAQSTGRAGPALFQQAEQWRERLIDEGISAAADLPGDPGPTLPRLIERAQRERETGRPKGAARALFRHIHAILENPSPDQPSSSDDDDASANPAPSDDDASATPAPSDDDDN